MKDFFWPFKHYREIGKRGDVVARWLVLSGLLWLILGQMPPREYASSWLLLAVSAAVVVAIAAAAVSSALLFVWLVFYVVDAGR